MDISTADALLAEVYGRYLESWSCGDPLQKLIKIVLNHRTTSAHALRALANLHAHCPTWADVAALDHDTLADLVRPAGLAKPKAARIAGILERIWLEAGEYSLDLLRPMENRAATRFLRSLPGVGDHTAALLLLFALGRPGVMPVDTHIHRVARRLGWAAHDASARVVQQAIEQAAPDRILMDLHVNLIELGHRHCRDGNPECLECPLSDHCRSARLQPQW